MAKKTKKKLKNIPAKILGQSLKNTSKAYRAKPRLSNYFMSYGNALGGQRFSKKTQRVKEGPGRPVGDYKHRDPFTGKPIPATLYYKRIKDFKRLQQQQAQLKDAQEIQRLAKRGIPPEQAKQIIDQKQLQSVGVQPQPQLTPEQIRQLQVQQMMERNEIPEQMPSTYPSQAVRPIWRRQAYEDTDWGLFGRKKVVRGLPQSYWN